MPIRLPSTSETPQRVQELAKQLRELRASTAATVTPVARQVVRAQTTADTATTDAATAQQTATGAQTTASGALGVAQGASYDASVAQQTAQQASSDARTANGTAQTAQQQAQAAQTTATTAQTTATSASDAAMNAADLAASKGKTIVQVTAPTGANADPANLWINISTDSSGVPKNQPNRYGPSTVPDPNTVALILPSTANQAELEVMRISVAPGVLTSVALTLSASMSLNGVVKTSVARLRDGASGAVLATYTFSDKGDSTNGDAETWTLPSDFTATPTASVLVVTIQSSVGNVEVYSLHRTMTANNWQPITDAQALAAAQSAATAAATAQAAKDVADQANTAAGIAKQAAADANTAALQAAGIANGKGKVIVQASKPTGANAAVGNLWIRTTDNTPWAYDSSIPDWVQVTDKTATDAATAAVQAQQAATAAANAAKAAQDTADGKPLVLFSTSTPSGTAPTGSIWFQWDASKNVAGQWLQSGTLASPTWTPQQIRSEVIANLDLAKLTAGSAAIADLVAQKIAASTANFQTVNVSNLFVTSGATLSQAVIDFLFVNVVQAKKLVAGQIDAGSITADNFKVRGITSRATIYVSPTADDGDYPYGRPNAYYSARGLEWTIDRQDGNGYVVGQRHDALISIASRYGGLLFSAFPYVRGDTSDPRLYLDVGFYEDGSWWGVHTSNGVWAERLRVRGNAHADVVQIGKGRALSGLGMSSTVNDPTPQMIIDTSSTGSSSDPAVRVNTFGGPVTAGLVTASTAVKYQDGTQQTTAYVAPADTGWIAPAVLTGSGYSVGTLQIRKRGNRTTIRGQLNRSSTVAAVNKAITLPDASWSPTQQMIMSVTATSGVTARVNVNTDGTIDIRDIAGSPGTYLIFALEWYND